MHPFDRITDEINDNLKNVPQETEAERQQEKELHQREILGRLMGEKLTPRQFEILTGKYSDKDTKLRHVKDGLHDKFLSNRQQIRLAEENVERIRRRKVIDGEWTEAESHHAIRQWLQEKCDDIPGPELLRKQRRTIDVISEAIVVMDCPERLLEKEYHFDEGLGQTLTEHVEELNIRYPGVKVMTRRDRDGFAVVKTVYKNEYAYELDAIEAFDPETARDDMNQTLEMVLDRILPGTPQDVISEVSQNMGDVLSKM